MVNDIAFSYETLHTGDKLTSIYGRLEVDALPNPGETIQVNKMVNGEVVLTRPVNVGTNAKFNENGKVVASFNYKSDTDIDVNEND